MYIWNQGKGWKLQNIPEFCYEEKGDSCVTTFPVQFPNCVSNLHMYTVLNIGCFTHTRINTY